MLYMVLNTPLEKSYCKVVTKCDRGLILSALGIAKFASYYKVRCKIVKHSQSYDIFLIVYVLHPILWSCFYQWHDHLMHFTTT